MYSGNEFLWIEVTLLCFKGALLELTCIIAASQSDFEHIYA